MLRSDRTEVTRTRNGIQVHVSLKEKSLRKERALKGDRGQSVSVFPNTITLDSKTHFIDGMEQKPTCL